MLPEDVADDDSGFLRLGNVCHASGQNGISVVYFAISGQKTDKPLWFEVPSVEESSGNEIRETSYRECGHR